MAANAIPALIQLLTLPFFPDSPRYLLIDKKDKEGCIKGKETGHKAFVLLAVRAWKLCLLALCNEWMQCPYLWAFQVFSDPNGSC